MVVGLPYDVRAVVRECRRLLGTPDAVPPLTSQSVHAHIFNPLDWDVPAGLWVEYGIDGPMRESPASDATDDQRQAIADDPTRNGWAAMSVKFEPVYWWPDISHTRASDHDLAPGWCRSWAGGWTNRSCRGDGKPTARPPTFPTATAIKISRHSAMPLAA